MALFTVQPGRSFHSVQEVYTADKPRLSISGWFHGASPPPGADGASLRQLKGQRSGQSGAAAEGTAAGQHGGPAEAHAADGQAADAAVHVSVHSSAEAAAAERAAHSKHGQRTNAAAALAFEPLPHAQRHKQAHNGASGLCAPSAHPHSHNSSLQVDNAADACGQEEHDAEGGEDDSLTPAEKRFLASWINPAYLQSKALRRLVAQWESSSCVELRAFLHEERAAAVRPCLPLEKSLAILCCACAFVLASMSDFVHCRA